MSRRARRREAAMEAKRATSYGFEPLRDDDTPDHDPDDWHGPAGWWQHDPDAQEQQAPRE